MSYHTDWRLDFDPGTAQMCPTCGVFGQFDYASLIAAELDFDPFSQSCSWHSWEEDMRKFSKKYPEVLFTLYAEGEGQEDIWVAYFRNGLMHDGMAEIRLPDFDETKLK